jgi:hypothetical protein
MKRGSMKLMYQLIILGCFVNNAWKSSGPTRKIKNNNPEAQKDMKNICFCISCEQKTVHCFLRTCKTCKDKTVTFKDWASKKKHQNEWMCKRKYHKYKLLRVKMLLNL